MCMVYVAHFFIDLGRPSNLCTYFYCNVYLMLCSLHKCLGVQFSQPKVYTAVAPPPPPTDPTPTVEQTNWCFQNHRTIITSACSRPENKPGIPKTTCLNYNKTGIWIVSIFYDNQVNLKFEHLYTTCDVSFLEIFEDTTAITDQRKKICGSLLTFYKSESTKVYIRLYAKMATSMPSFSASFTVFTPGKYALKIFQQNTYCRTNHII